MSARQKDRQNQSGSGESSPFAEAIIAVITGLIKPESGAEAHSHALQLAQIAFSMPYGNEKAIIDALLHLPRPIAEKQVFLMVLVLAGEVIRADAILDAIKTLLEEAKTQRWRLDHNSPELEGWLMLLPFSDRPSSTLDAVRMLEPNLRHPWRLRRLLSALGHAPSAVAERMLVTLSQIDVRFLNDNSWLAALDQRGTASSARALLNLICEGKFGEAKGGIDTLISRSLAHCMQTHPDLRGEVFQRFESLSAGQPKALLERAIADVADEDGVLTLARAYAALGKPFDGLLHTAIRHVAVGQRPSNDWVGANEVFSVPVPYLRKRLFEMVKDDSAESRLASACLTAIDELRDDYGPAGSEPRHPDIDSGRPWPLAADE